MQARNAGELTEMKFHLAASERDYTISVPFMTHHYDCLLDNGTQILKVQIKKASHRERSEESPAYGITLKRGSKGQYRGYTKEEVDVFAIYIEPLDVWYFIPFEMIADSKRLSLRPLSEVSRYNAFKDNWHVFNELMR